MDKKVRNGIIGFLAFNLVTSGICALSEHFRKKEEEARRSKELERSLEETHELAKSFEGLTDWKWFDEINEKIQRDQAYKNEKNLVIYLYAVIKQRKTLMKSEQDNLLAIVRHNKLVDGIDLEKADDQELLKYLETECKFDIFDGVPKLISKTKCIVLHSLKELGIESIS